MSKKTLAWLAALLAVLAGGGVVAITVLPDDTGPAPAAKTLTVAVDGLDAGRADDRSIAVPKAVVDQVAPRLEDDLREPPPATSPSELAAIAEAEDANRATTDELPTAGATAGFEGC